MNQIIKLLIEIGPVLIFIWANGHYSDENGIGGAIPATKIFMVAMVISMVFAKILLKRVTPMLWASGILVGIFGALAIYFDDIIFMKIKPTILYSMFAFLLLGGVYKGKYFIKNLMEVGFPPVEEIAWMKMSRNWGLFFLGCAILNEILWRNFSFDEWLKMKIWVFIPLSFIFALAQMPIIMKHQLDEVDEKED